MKNTPTYNDLLVKSRKYCAAAEHCKSEVEGKLISWGASQEMAGEIIYRLEEENFISEMRYVEWYARSKVNQNQWGVVKIIHGLTRHRIPDDLIEYAVKQINQEQYLTNLQLLITAKSKQIKDQDPAIRKQKLAAFLIAKGYEPEIVENLIEHNE